MGEAWRTVVGYEGRYEVSDLGRVRSLPGGFRKGGPLRPCLVSGGRYQMVSLCAEGTVRKRYVHHLVAEAFIGLRPEGLDVCHTNGDSVDNRASNLRYDTVSANNRDAIAQGRHSEARRTHCDSGHMLSPENVYLTRGVSADGGPKTNRRCKQCARAWTAAYKQRRQLTSA